MRRVRFISEMQMIGFPLEEAIAYADAIVRAGGKVSYEGFYHDTVYQMTRLGVSVFRHYHKDTNSNNNLREVSK